MPRALVVHGGQSSHFCCFKTGWLARSAVARSVAAAVQTLRRAPRRVRGVGGDGGAGGAPAGRTGRQRRSCGKLAAAHAPGSAPVRLAVASVTAWYSVTLGPFREP